MSLITINVGDTVVQVLPDSTLGQSQPPAPVVTMKQARLALLQANRLDQVDAAIAALPEADRKRAQIEWEHSATIERDNPVLILLAQAIGMPDAEIDSLFAVAAQL